MDEPPTPDWLMGRHLDSTEDILEAVDRLVAPNYTTFKKGGMNWVNAPDITVLEEPTEHTVKVLIPLPHLHESEYTVDDIQRILAPCIAAGVKLAVEVHPGDG
jgi:hypothetical protein